MFYVYGVSGQSFRGSMEQLRQIERVGASARAHAIKSIGRDGIDPALLLPASLVEPVPVPAPASDEAHRSALAAYTQTEKVVPQRQAVKRVDQLMSRTVITIAETATALQAWQTLIQHGVGQAPVVNQDSILVGLVSRADLLRPEHLPIVGNVQVWRTLLAQSVADLMRTPVPSAAPDADIRRVASVLLDHGLSGLAVVDEQGLVTGFISRSDILRAMVTEPPLDLWG